MHTQSNRHHAATIARMLLHPPLFRAVLLCRSAAVTQQLLSSAQSALPGYLPCVHVRVCVCVCVHSVGTTFHQMRTRHAGWPGNISWRSSHLAYWPEHIHEDIISSAHSLLPLSLTSSFVSPAPRPSAPSPTTCIRPKHRSEGTLMPKGTCRMHLRRNIVYSARCLISKSACVEAAAAAAPDSRSPNKLFSFCIQLQNSLSFSFFPHSASKKNYNRAETFLLDSSAVGSCSKNVFLSLFSLFRGKQSHLFSSPHCCVFWNLGRNVCCCCCCCCLWVQ